MADWHILLAGTGAAFVMTSLLLRPLTALLRRRAILDVPNERSSHVTAIPKGGGIVVLFVVLTGWYLTSWFTMDALGFNHIALIVCIAAIFGIVSWIDDLKGLSPIFRLLTHLCGAGLAIYFAPFQGPIFQGLIDPTLDLTVAALLWVWFINLFNFMDGIDGISGVQSITICLGIILIGIIVPELGVYAPYAALLLGASAGFLVWNWPPAKIFLGDVGSAPLGFLLGWLLLSLAAKGEWATALILPAYYLADATITLIRRALRGKKVWQAHREHFYQKAVASGFSHGQVTLSVLVAGLLLTGIAVVNIIGYPVVSVIGTGIIVVSLLVFFSR